MVAKWRFIVLAASILLPFCAHAGTDPAVQGLVDLVQRRMPNHVDDFKFILSNASSSAGQVNDQYYVSSGVNGSIVVQGNSRSALASG
jgi:alpha-N-acetylglucosaminidase